MTKKIRDTIAKYKMLEIGDAIVVGVSGGADSTALLHFLVSLRDEFELEIIAAHLNHGLRGSESDGDENFVKALCKRLDVEFFAETIDLKSLAEDRGVALEEAGRVARYDFFSRLIEKRCDCKSGKLALAHSLNDSVETMLFNLARGTGIRGLCGIPPTRTGRSGSLEYAVIRPFIECERDEIEKYCEENGLEFRTDSSNKSDDYARNRIRHHTLPSLSSVNTAFLKNAARLSDLLRADADYLDEIATRAINLMKLGNNQYLRDKYLEYALPIRSRVLRELLAQQGIEVDRGKLLRLDEIILKGSGAEQLSKEVFLQSRRQVFGVEAQRTHTEFFCLPVELPKNGDTVEIDVFSHKKLRLMNTDYEYCEENIKYTANGLKNVLDCARISGIAKLRQKCSDDKIKLMGRGVTKSLKKLFQEAKISPYEREKLLVLADDVGPIWVEGFGVAERVSVSIKSSEIINIEVECGGISHD